MKAPIGGEDFMKDKWPNVGTGKTISEQVKRWMDKSKVYGM